jgi:hypothetical protein
LNGFVSETDIDSGMFSVKVRLQKVRLQKVRLQKVRLQKPM